MKEAIADNKGGELDSDFDNTGGFSITYPDLLKNFNYHFYQELRTMLDFYQKSLLKVTFTAACL